MNKQRNLETISQVILLLIVFAACSLSFADLIRKKDGSVIEGKISNQTDEKVTILSFPSLVKINVPMSEIDKIEKTESIELPANIRQVYDKSNALLSQGKPHEAALILIEALDTNGQGSGMLFQTLDSALGQALALADKTSEDAAQLKTAINQYESLLNGANKPAFQKFIRQYPRWQSMGDDIKNKLSQAYFNQAVADFNQNNPALYSQIEANLEKALSMTPQNEPRYLQILESSGIFNLKHQKKYKAAEEAFRKGYDLAANPDIKQKFQIYLRQTAEAKNERANTEETPKPSPPTQNQSTETPAASTQTVAAPPLPFKAFWKKVWKEMTNKQYKAAFALIWERTTESNIPPLIIIGLLIILFYWIVPAIIIEWRGRRADFLAARMATFVKYTGLVGLAAYLIILLFKTFISLGKKRDRCPYCKKAIDNIDIYANYDFRICPHCHENITPIYSLEDYIFHLVKTVQVASKKRGTYAEGMNILEKDAMAKLIRAIITTAYRKRSSDLHIEPDLEGLKIRARIDGVLYEILNLPKDVSDTVVSAIKVMTNLDISEKRIPQDGRMSMWVDSRDLDLRISTSPAAQGEKVSIRILDPTSILVDSTKLGLDGENLENFERTIRKPYGLVLVTGPSGSGKSTTLYVALHTINTGDKNIVTIEDPIEYKLEGISQQQVNVAANFTFATGLRSILRQDPDVIMVGEIRDKETADIGIDAATTGHLVFTTLHTIDAPTAFSRLNDLGIPTKRFAPVLLAIIAQRLIRLNCPDCKKPYKPSKPDLELIGLLDETDIVFMKGTGCQTCNNTGYFGRTGIFEMLIPDSEMKKILETDPAVSVISALAKKKGMHTLREEGMIKIKNGLTTVEEVLRVTS